MKTLFGCFLLLVAAATMARGYGQFALIAAFLGIQFLLPPGHSGAESGISFGDGDGGGD
jgi:hypothetical protein